MPRCCRCLDPCIQPNRDAKRNINFYEHKAKRSAATPKEVQLPVYTVKLAHPPTHGHAEPDFSRQGEESFISAQSTSSGASALRQFDPDANKHATYKAYKPQTSANSRGAQGSTSPERATRHPGYGNQQPIEVQVQIYHRSGFSLFPDFLCDVNTEEVYISWVLSVGGVWLPFLYVLSGILLQNARNSARSSKLLVFTSKVQRVLAFYERKSTILRSWSFFPSLNDRIT